MLQIFSLPIKNVLQLLYIIAHEIMVSEHTHGQWKASAAGRQFAGVTHQ